MVCKPMLGYPRGPRVDILASGRYHELSFRHDLPTHLEEQRHTRSSLHEHSISAPCELPFRSVTEDGVVEVRLYQCGVHCWKLDYCQFTE